MTTGVKSLETEAVTALSSFLDTHLPPNRVVTLFGPLVAIISGTIASWFGKHFPGLGLNMSNTAGTIMQGIDFAIGALVTLALQHKWLAGWQQYQAIQVSGSATAAAPAASPPAALATALPPFQPRASTTRRSTCRRP